MHRGLEEPVAALAVALGDVHRRVGVADQLVGVGRRVALGDRDAEAGAQHDLLPVQAQRRHQRLEDPLGGVGRLLRRSRRPRAGSRTRRRRSAPRCRWRGCWRRGAWRPRAGTLSPAAWPRLSLTVLKSSRSMKSTARRLSSRRRGRPRGARARRTGRGWAGASPDRGTPGGRAAPRTPCVRRCRAH